MFSKQSPNSLSLYLPVESVRNIFTLIYLDLTPHNDESPPMKYSILG